jgi:hypothetical protein
MIHWHVGFSQIDNILNNYAAVKSVRYEVFETIINMISPIYQFYWQIEE